MRDLITFLAVIAIRQRKGVKTYGAKTKKGISNNIIDNDLVVRKLDFVGSKFTWKRIFTHAGYLERGFRLLGRVHREMFPNTRPGPSGDVWILDHYAWKICVILIFDFEDWIRRHLFIVFGTLMVLFSHNLWPFLRFRQQNCCCCLSVAFWPKFTLVIRLFGITFIVKTESSLVFKHFDRTWVDTEGLIILCVVT